MMSNNVLSDKGRGTWFAMPSSWHSSACFCSS